MTKPGSLLAHLKRAAEPGGNVVRLDRATDAEPALHEVERAPRAKGVPDDVDDDIAALLAPLDELVRQQVREAEARAAHPVEVVEVALSASVVPMVPPAEPRVTALSAKQGIDLVVKSQEVVS